MEIVSKPYPRRGAADLRRSGPSHDYGAERSVGGWGTGARLWCGTVAGNLKVRTARDYGAERNGSEPYARLRCGTGSEGGEGTVLASYVVRFIK